MTKDECELTKARERLMMCLIGDLVDYRDLLGSARFYEGRNWQRDWNDTYATCQPFGRERRTFQRTGLYGDQYQRIE